MCSVRGVFVYLLVLGLTWGVASGGESWTGLLAEADSLTKVEEWDSALALETKALELAQEEFGREDTTLVSLLARVGTSNRRAGHFGVAESLYTRALAIREKALGPEHPDLAASLHRLAGIYMDQGKYAEAEPLLKRAVAVREKALGPDHPDLAKTLNTLGALFTYQGDYQQAESSFKRALAVREKTLGPDHADVAQTLSNLGLLFWYQGKYEQAESYLKQALALREKLLGPDHADVAQTLSNLANVYNEQGRYQDSEILCLRALAIVKKVRGPEHPDFARDLNRLGCVYLDQGKHAEAESSFKRALAIYEKTLGPEHPFAAEPLNNLGALFGLRADYQQAESSFKRVLAIKEKAAGPDHPDVAKALINLANICADQGKYEDSELLNERALAIQEKVLGPDHPDLRMTLNNLANVSEAQGRYRDSELLYLRALAVCEKAYGPDNPEVATPVGNLAVLYQNWGKYRESEPMHLRALAIREKALGPAHPEVATSLSNLATLYQDQGRYQESEPLYARAIAIWESEFGPEHPDVARGLMNLGTLCRDQGKYDQAEPLYLRALAIWERVYGPEHPMSAMCLYNLGSLFADQGRYPEAEPLYEQALAAWQKVFGPDHPNVALSVESLSNLHRQQRDIVHAIELAERACTIRRNHFVENSIGLSEKDALTFSQASRASLSKYLSCYHDLGSVDAATLWEAADLAVSSKGQVSDGIFEKQRSLVEEQDSTTLGLAESLRYAKFRLSSLFVGGPGEDVQAHRASLDSLSEVAGSLESELSRRSASYRRSEDRKEISATRLVSLLPENSTLIEYVKYNYQELEPESSIPHYLVVVLGETEVPLIVDLGEASGIDSLVADYRGHMLKVSSREHLPLKTYEDRYATLAGRLYDALIGPIQDHITGRDLVFIAPDGALNLISFAALIDHEGKYLIETVPIHYLSAGRDLIRLQYRDTPGHGLFALGDPDYNRVGEMRVAQVGAIGEAPAGPYVTRSVRSGCGALDKMEVDRLPESRNEVERVAAGWSSYSDEPARLYLGAEATEDNVKADAPETRVIHLATHGYFLEGECKPSEPQPSYDSDRGFVGENPLLLSGLLLAGANLHGKMADSLGCEDGILTAYEVSGMDLAGTDLVVLSACETGLGEVKEGEGVYGLRRAFQMAGARTVVSALWPVPDDVTAEMMAALYSQSGESLPERLRAIQLSEIKRLRSRGLSDHPYRWAGFIALGDW